MGCVAVIVRLLVALAWCGWLAPLQLPVASAAGRTLVSERRELISNGEDAPPGRYPYYCAVGRAGLQDDTVTYRLQHCGGSLIHPQVVVTAAHCTAGLSGRVLRGLAVLCNTTRLGTVGDGAEFRRVTQALVHPNATAVREALGLRPTAPDPSSMSLQEILSQESPMSSPAEPFTEGDVALLLLDSPIGTLPPVPVATTDEWDAIDTAGTPLTVVGFGAVSEGRGPSAFPRVLQEGSMPLVDPNRCASYYSQSEFEGVRQYIDGSLAICAGYSIGAKTLPCPGDSGGPLLYAPDSNDSSKDFQVGIVSGGAGSCGGPALPGVFLRLDTYRPWIDTALQSVDASGNLPDGAVAPGSPVTGNGTAPASAEQYTMPGGTPPSAGAPVAVPLPALPTPPGAVPGLLPPEYQPIGSP